MVFLPRLITTGAREPGSFSSPSCLRVREKAWPTTAAAESPQARQRMPAAAGPAGKRNEVIVAPIIMTEAPESRCRSSRRKISGNVR